MTEDLLQLICYHFQIRPNRLWNGLFFEAQVVLHMIWNAMLGRIVICYCPMNLIVGRAEMSRDFQEVYLTTAITNCILTTIIFTSPDLQAYLPKEGIWCLGTVRANRIPNCNLISGDKLKKQGRG